MHRIGDIVDDRYQLTRPLGVRRGAEMWDAEHQIVGRRVTLKIVPSEVGTDPAVRQRLVAEARAATEIAHPSVFEIYDLRVLPNGLSYLVTEPIRGETLADVIGRQGAMQPEDACQVILQVLAGLEAAHAVNIAHGDLRAENVILRRGSGGQLVVKVLDYGIATSERVGPPASADMPVRLTELHADIRGVAALLYEMLTGRINAQKMPARAEAGGAPAMMATAEALVPAIPAGLARIVDQTLAATSGKRVESAKEMAALLAPFAVSERPPSLAPRDSMMPFLSPEARKSRGMARLERAVLGLADPKEKSSVRPNLVLIENAQQEATAARPASTDLPDLVEPHIPRPPRSPKHLGSALPRFTRSDRIEISARPRKKSSLPSRRWKAAQKPTEPRAPKIVDAGPRPATNSPLRLWLAVLLSLTGLLAGLLLARLVHF